MTFPSTCSATALKTTSLHSFGYLLKEPFHVILICNISNLQNRFVIIWIVMHDWGKRLNAHGLRLDLLSTVVNKQISVNLDSFWTQSSMRTDAVTDYDIVLLSRNSKECGRNMRQKIKGEGAFLLCHTEQVFGPGSKSSAVDFISTLRWHIHVEWKQQ